MAGFLGRLPPGHLARAAGALLVVLVVVLAATGQLPGAGSFLPRTVSKNVRDQGSGTVHVVLCNDGTDLRSTVVAIKSARQAAADPEALQFHLVTAVELASLSEALLSAHLPDIPVQVHSDASVQTRVQIASGGSGATAAAGPSRRSTNNMVLAPFYLDDFLGARVKGLRRVVYVDTGTVVLGDLAELHNVDLQGHAVAAVRSCSQHWSDVFNLNALKSLGYHGFNPNACVASRAVLVIDLSHWRRQGASRKIEEWIERHHALQDQLWSGDISHAPWLLALGEEYIPLPEQWACTGLGREIMSDQESQTVRHGGFDKKSLRRLGLRTDDYGSIFPSLSTCTATAKLLRFDGGMPPWYADAFNGTLPLCVLPSSLLGSKLHRDMSVRVKVFCEWTPFVNCSDLWLQHMSPDLSCALKDFALEWSEVEQEWDDRWQDLIWTADAERAENAERMGRRPPKAGRGQDVDDKRSAEEKLAKARGGKQLSKSQRKRQDEKDVALKRQAKLNREMDIAMQKEEQRLVDQRRIARVQRFHGAAETEPSEPAGQDQAESSEAEPPAAPVLAGAADASGGAARAAPAAAAEIGEGAEVQDPEAAADAA